MFATFFIFVGLLIAGTLFFAKKKVLRKAACFRLYKVRDDLVCLVAEEKLNEDSRVFQYYYKRTNNLLNHAPNIGLDDLLESIFLIKRNGNLEKAVQKVKKEADDISSLKELKDPEVRAVVVDYYNASREMILAHSSIFRLLYIGLIKGVISPQFENLLPSTTQYALRVAKFANDEARTMADPHCPA
jgi:autonomous glycyl radical cofactor GrcA